MDNDFIDIWSNINKPIEEITELTISSMVELNNENYDSKILLSAIAKLIIENYKLTKLKENSWQ